MSKWNKPTDPANNRKLLAQARRELADSSRQPNKGLTSMELYRRRILINEDKYQFLAELMRLGELRDESRTPDFVARFNAEHGTRHKPFVHPAPIKIKEPTQCDLFS
jgi:hypothetical protein